MARKVSIMSLQRKQAARLPFGWDSLFLVLFVLYLVIPLGATLLFGLSGGNGLDFSSYQQIFADKDFSNTLLLSLELSLASTVLAVVLVTPTVYWMQLRLPQARPLLDFLSLVPFTVPAILLTVGLSEVYGGSNIFINILSLGLVPLLIPIRELKDNLEMREMRHRGNVVRMISENIERRTEFVSE